MQRAVAVTADEAGGTVLSWQPIRPALRPHALHQRAAPRHLYVRASGCERAAASCAALRPPCIHGAGAPAALPRLGPSPQHAASNDLQMSADTFARTELFANKGDELQSKGHLLRAAENYGRAAEAARALGPDNLVTLHFQLMQGNQLIATAIAAFSVNTADPQNHAAHRAESIALFSGAIEALERRRMAGTLLEGKCVAAEVAWRARKIEHDNPDLHFKTLAC